MRATDHGHNCSSIIAEDMAMGGPQCRAAVKAIIQAPHDWKIH